MMAGVVSAAPAPEGTRERQVARRTLLKSAREAFDAGLSPNRWRDREAAPWALELVEERDVDAVIAIIPRPWRLEEVSRMLRHSSIAVTERHYARFLPEALPVTVRAEAIAPADGMLPPEPAASAAGEEVIMLELSSASVLGPSVGPVGPEDRDFLSRLGELNPGPTVYEAVGDRARSFCKSAIRTQAGKAREVLQAIAAGDTRRALALATTLAGTALEHEAELDAQAPARRELVG